MTTSEMITLFKLKYDAASSLAAPDWLNSDIVSFLNVSQLLVVDALYEQKRWDLLTEIIFLEQNLQNDITIAHDYPNSVWKIAKSSLSEVYRGFVHAMAEVNMSGSVNTYNKIVEKIPINMLNKILITFNNQRPKFKQCYFFEDHFGTLFVMGDYYTTVVEVSLTYLRNPNIMQIAPQVSCQLNNSLHEKIVEVAVNEAIKSIHISKITPQEQNKQ
jgi:hypothetical protein